MVLKRYFSNCERRWHLLITDVSLNLLKEPTFSPKSIFLVLQSFALCLRMKPSRLAIQLFSPPISVDFEVSYNSKQSPSTVICVRYHCFSVLYVINSLTLRSCDYSNVSVAAATCTCGARSISDKKHSTRKCLL